MVALNMAFFLVTEPCPSGSIPSASSRGSMPALVSSLIYLTLDGKLGMTSPVSEDLSGASSALSPSGPFAMSQLKTRHAVLY